jgi:stage II sporulation protein D
MQKKAGMIVVSGRGFGHHLGLCQWGARQMVREGCDYKQILRYYYPETYFIKIL